MAPRSNSYRTSRTIVIAGVVLLFVVAALIGLLLSLGADVTDDEPSGAGPVAEVAAALPAG